MARRIHNNNATASRDGLESGRPAEEEPGRGRPSERSVGRSAPLRPGPEVHGEGDWVDFRDALRAARLRDGRYLVLVEEDEKAECLVYYLADPLAGAGR